MKKSSKTTAPKIPVDISSYFTKKPVATGSRSQAPPATEKSENFRKPPPPKEVTPERVSSSSNSSSKRKADADPSPSSSTKRSSSHGHKTPEKPKASAATTRDSSPELLTPENKKRREHSSRSPTTKKGSSHGHKTPEKPKTSTATAKDSTPELLTPENKKRREHSSRSPTTKKGSHSHKSPDKAKASTATARATDSAPKSTPDDKKHRKRSTPSSSSSKKGSRSHKTPDKPKPKPKASASTATDSAPELTPDEKKRKQQSNYFKHISRAPPKNLGAKEIPVGAPDCLKGLTFVLTGVLDSLERDDVTQLVGKYGGRVTGSVSGKTTHLIVGDEPGESKIKKAKDLKIPQITEDDLLDMIRKSNPNQPESQTMIGFTSDDEELSDTDISLSKIEMPDEGKVVEVSPSKDSGVGSSQSQSVVVTPQPSTPKSKTKSLREEAQAKPIASASAPMEKEKPAHVGISSLMWVDKYKPGSLKNVVGQAGDKSNAQKLVKWLQNWFQYHGKAGEKAKSSWPGLKDPEGKTFKAALLSGSPGIGKTSTAHLACKQVNYDFFEMNASDTRNKRGLHEIASDALTSKSILQMGSHNELTSKHVLIMDEVDGMSGNEDRGGIQELITLIKTSRVPVICICNDRNHQKIRSLANYCFDLRFNKPSNEQLKGFIQSVCFKEKLKLPIESVQQLINSSDHDIRQILNQLELLKECSSTQQICNPRKDLKFGPWDVVRKVFSAQEHVGMSIHDKNNLFFQDYSFGPLFVQENYVKWTPLKAKGNKYKTLDRIKLSAEAIATGDLVDNIIRRSNNWSLLPTQAIFASILPGEYMEGNHVTGIEFPRWLGKNSHRNKLSRLLQQLHNHVHLEVSGSLEALNMDYLPYLRRSIVNPLAAGDVGTAVEGMQSYSLIREDLDNINELALWPGMRNPLEKLDSKTKAAFTRQVNKEVVVPYSVIKITKGKGKAGSTEDLEGLEDDEMNEEEDEEEEDKIESDAMIKSKKTKVSSSSTSTKGGKSKTEDDDNNNPKPSTSKASSSKRKTDQDRGSSSKRGRK